MLFRKVLVDDGSALNLLFAGALKELGLRIEDLTPSNSFWDVVPGRASKLLEEITLPVQFGTTSNYRVEHINFYIADFMPYLVGQLWPSSWSYRTMPIWC